MFEDISSDDALAPLHHPASLVAHINDNSAASIG
jgi:hypothetical protein